jgi:signal transduction histidine kinase
LNWSHRQSFDVYKRKANEKRLSIKLSIDKTPHLNANLVLLEILVSNIISNAIRHANDGGIVTIESTTSCLSVSNSGAPLEHPEKIFHRFHFSVLIQAMREVKFY